MANQFEIAAFVDEFGSINTDPWEEGGIVVLQEKPAKYLVGFIQPHPGSVDAKVIGSDMDVAVKLSTRFGMKCIAGGRYDLRHESGPKIEWNACLCVGKVSPEFTQFLLQQIRELVANNPNIDM